MLKFHEDGDIVMDYGALQDLNLLNIVTVKCFHRPKSYTDKQ